MIINNRKPSTAVCHMAGGLYFMWFWPLRVLHHKSASQNSFSAWASFGLSGPEVEPLTAPPAMGPLLWKVLQYFRLDLFIYSVKTFSLFILFTYSVFVRKTKYFPPPRTAEEKPDVVNRKRQSGWGIRPSSTRMKWRPACLGMTTGQ